ncbi:MAG: magnesium transporter [Chlamydiota bacterium]
MSGKKKVHSLLDLMKPIHFVLYDSQTIEGAVQQLRTFNVDEKIIYFYVIDENQHFVGVVSTRNLLLSPSDAHLSQIMDPNVIFLTNTQNLENALEIFTKSNLLAIPVVDENRKLLGIVDIEMYVEESFDVAHKRHRQEIFQIMGVTFEDEKRFSLWLDYRKRMPWIFCNVLSGLICAWIAFFNEKVLSQIFILAMFIPLVLTLSESIAMQSMAQSLQYLRKEHIPWGRLHKEMKTIFLMALSSGFFVFFIASFWKNGFYPACAIGMGIFLSILLSSFFGGLFPILLHKLRLDPKVASGPIILMGADIFTTSLYFGLASWWLL